MAKKKLSMKTKLTSTPSPAENTEELDLIKKPTIYPKSYRWKKYDLEVIEELVFMTNEISKNYKAKPINILRGALLLAQKQKPEKLLEIILEAEKKVRISGIEE
jgi:hypothetical protein